ncbi:hypothetical protein MGA5115_01852 [Marinomonas gallaica]|uniref:Uncharacterized protein n=1 Tax=Marinomonas gallaica TaxID=1806667 RepID=A0A1C3JRK3_9GAMM|nr:hypothetical protein MGA5115_01852 [Marinomonas gallaica]SBT20062.1 hypothetical protein MGA5116_00645 [Marinomonas gallaica]
MEHRVERPFPGSTQRQRDTKHSNYKVDQLDKKSAKTGNWGQMKTNTKATSVCHTWLF